MSSLPARIKKIQSKMKVLECSQESFHYKSMGIFPDAQGQLTPQPLVQSVQYTALHLYFNYARLLRIEY